MSIGSLLIGLALALLVVPFVVGPFLRPAGRRAAAGAGGLSPEDSKRLALAALRDLDFDFRTGKIAEEDYAGLRQRLVADAAQALKTAEAAAPNADIDDRIEASVRALRRQPGPRAAADAACPKCQAPARSGDKFCARCGAALERQCSQCHGPLRPGDKFCAHCGASQ